MQNPNLDTEWNDALRRHGIIPEKKELEMTQDEIENVVDNVIKQKTEGRPLDKLSLDELDEKEDDEDDAILQQIRYLISVIIIFHFLSNFCLHHFSTLCFCA